MSHSPSSSPGCCAAQLEHNRCTKSGVSQPFSAPGCCAARLEHNRCTKSGISQPFSAPGCYTAQLKQNRCTVRCLTALHHHLAVIQLNRNRTASGHSFLTPLQHTWLLCGSTRTEQVYKVQSQVSHTPSAHLAVMWLS